MLVKSTDSLEAGIMPGPELLEAMGRFNTALAAANVLLGGDGLKPSSAGVRIHIGDDERTVSKGPFDPAEELIAGFWVGEVRDMEEAIAWASQCRSPVIWKCVLSMSRQTLGKPTLRSSLDSLIRSDCWQRSTT